ncbi:hypothetical protein IEO21_07665 [Rhodonia placenta]|uniref:Uncharacterized protein n=1 Tax=Rhodonia placenta TaxID=104341 RepID=A0A8H7TZG0_9APHY|nr:hypothetical protein IEO21_07665 [Postia placenta]
MTRFPGVVDLRVSIFILCPLAKFDRLLQESRPGLVPSCPNYGRGPQS